MAIQIVQCEVRSLEETLPVSDPVVQDALLQRPPCRFEQFQLQRFEKVPAGGTVDDVTSLSLSANDKAVRIILDIAHNIRAMEALVVRVQRFFPNRSIRYLM